MITCHKVEVSFVAPWKKKHYWKPINLTWGF